MTVRFVMGTFLRVHVEAGKDSVPAREAFFKTVQNLENVLSFYREGSDVSRINQAAGRSDVQVSGETFRSIKLALRYAESTDGAFDPTFRSPGGGCFRSVSLDSASQKVRLREPAMVLDLGGIGKGFALDLAAERIRADFPASLIVADFGGQWLFWSRADGIHEIVSIEDPNLEGRALSSLSIDRNCSVSTSSQSQRPGHLVDPRSNSLAAACSSVTAVANTGAEAEALSTALFVLGPSRAREILKLFPDARAMLH